MNLSESIYCKCCVVKKREWYSMVSDMIRYNCGKEFTYRDYVTDTHKLTRYWPNPDEYKAYRARLTELMNRPDPEPYDGD